MSGPWRSERPPDPPRPVNASPRPSLRCSYQARVSFVFADRQAMEPDIHVVVLFSGRSASGPQVGPRHRGRGVVECFPRRRSNSEASSSSSPSSGSGGSVSSKASTIDRTLLLGQAQGRFQDLSALLIHPNAPHRVGQVPGTPDVRSSNEVSLTGKVEERSSDRLGARHGLHDQGLGC